ncbi:MAG: hypothetical protein ACD_43C00089G0001 [uncultured bacterium]|nr:MAG: hypothetical protein ACD_43C00089G0001 [uncultured bacterium]
MTETTSLIPTIIQDVNTKQVLMLGYSNAESLAKTKTTGHVWFYSRSKQRLWEKGETSKNYLNVIKIFEDCDNDTLLILARPAGPTCHTGAISCFVRSNVAAAEVDILTLLNQVIADRQKKLPAESYTTELFQGGVKAIGNKITEEAIEVVQAARFESSERLAEETADLLYHVLVLLREKNVDWSAVLEVLQQRHKD